MIRVKLFHDQSRVWRRLVFKIRQLVRRGTKYYNLLEAKLSESFFCFVFFFPINNNEEEEEEEEEEENQK